MKFQDNYQDNYFLAAAVHQDTIIDFRRQARLRHQSSGSALHRHRLIATVQVNRLFTEMEDEMVTKAARLRKLWSADDDLDQELLNLQLSSVSSDYTFARPKGKSETSLNVTARSIRSTWCTMRNREAFEATASSITQRFVMPRRLWTKQTA